MRPRSSLEIHLSLRILFFWEMKESAIYCCLGLYVQWDVVFKSWAASRFYERISRNWLATHKVNGTIHVILNWHLDSREIVQRLKEVERLNVAAAKHEPCVVLLCRLMDIDPSVRPAISALIECHLVKRNESREIESETNCRPLAWRRCDGVLIINATELRRQVNERNNISSMSWLMLWQLLSSLASDFFNDLC